MASPSAIVAPRACAALVFALPALLLAACAPCGVEEECKGVDLAGAVGDDVIAPLLPKRPSPFPSLLPLVVAVAVAAAVGCVFAGASAATAERLLPLSPARAGCRRERLNGTSLRSVDDGGGALCSGSVAAASVVRAGRREESAVVDLNDWPDDRAVFTRSGQQRKRERESVCVCV